MKNKLILLVLVTAIFGYSCTNSNSQVQSASILEQEAAIAKNVPAKEFEKLIELKKDKIILDVRTAKEVAEGHLAQSTNIDYFADDFKDKLAKLDKSKPVMVYCHSGKRSGNTLKILKELGFVEIYNLETGIVGWEAAGLPVVK